MANHNESLDVMLRQRPELKGDKLTLHVDLARLTITVNEGVEINVPLEDVRTESGCLVLKAGKRDVRLDRPDRNFVEYSVSHYGMSYALLLALAEAHNVQIMNPDGTA